MASQKVMNCVGALTAIPKAQRDQLTNEDLTNVKKVGENGFRACASLSVGEKVGLRNTLAGLKVGGKRRKASSKKSSKSRKQRGGFSCGEGQVIDPVSGQCRAAGRVSCCVSW